MTARLHVVTDDGVLARPDIVDQASRLLRTLSGSIALHLRGPGTSGHRLFDVASRIHAAVGGGSLFINDRVDVALALPDTGVHLRGSSLPPEVVRTLLGPDRPIGLSVRAENPGQLSFESLDYLIAGTAFATATHPGGVVAGAEAIGRVAAASPVPVLAIGGISKDRIGVLISSGVYGVAVNRAVWSDPDPARAATIILTALDRALDRDAPSGRTEMRR